MKDHLIYCFDLEFINEETFEKGINLIEEAKITLNGFINYVISQKDKDNLTTIH